MVCESKTLLCGVMYVFDIVAPQRRLQGPSAIVSPSISLAHIASSPAPWIHTASLFTWAKLRLKSESIALMQGELIAGEREAALKDQALRHLRTRLQEEEEAREKQVSLHLRRLHISLGSR